MTAPHQSEPEFSFRAAYTCGARPRGAASTFCILAFFITFFVASACPSFADRIYLKGGGNRSLEGTIDESRTDPDRVYIRTSAGVLPVARSRIDRIEMRETITAEERKGDHFVRQGKLDRALERYLAAYTKVEEDETLERKISDINERIREKNERRYAHDFAKIDSAVESRRFKVAIKLADRLAEEAPSGSPKRRCREKLAETYVLQARNFRNMVDYSRAENSYRKAIDAYKRGPEARFELASMLKEQLINEDESLQLYEEGFDLVEKDPTLLEKEVFLRHRYDFAQVQSSQGNDRRAAELLWEIAQADESRLYPRSVDEAVEAYKKIQAELFEESPENAKAEAILIEIIERDPRQSTAHYLLGMVDCERGNWQTSISYLETAMERMVGPSTVTEQVLGRNCLAKSYRARDDLPKAIEHLNKVLRIQPSSYDTLCELGEIYYDLVEYERALELFLRASDFDDSGFRGHIGAGKALRVLKRYKESLDHFQKLVGLRVEELDFLFELGLVYSALNRHPEAREAYNSSAQLIRETHDLEDPETKALLSEIYARLGLTSVAERNYYQAIAQFNRSLNLNSGLAAALDGKGQAYRELGKLDDAEVNFKDAVAAAPKNPQYLLNMGVFYHKIKQDRKNALPYYYQYFEHGGVDPQVKDWIRECGGSPPQVS